MKMVTVEIAGEAYTFPKYEAGDRVVVGYSQETGTVIDTDCTSFGGYDMSDMPYLIRIDQPKPGYHSRGWDGLWNCAGDDLIPINGVEFHDGKVVFTDE